MVCMHVFAIVPQQVNCRELHVRVPLLRKYAAASPDSYLGASFDDKHTIGTFKFALDAGSSRRRQL